MSFDWRWICRATCWDPSFQVKLALMPNRHFPEGAPTGRLADPCWQLERRSGRNSKNASRSSDDAFYYSRLNSRCVQGWSGFGRQCASSPLRFQGEGRPPARMGGSRRDPIAIESFGASSKRFSPSVLPPLEECERSLERVQAACGALSWMLALLAEELERASFQRHHDVLACL